MSDRKRKCPHCGKMADEQLLVSGGYGVGDYNWAGECESCGAIWEYWQRGKSPERRWLDISFEDYEEEPDGEYEENPPEQSEEELDARLRELGYDPIELVQRMRARIEKAIDESPLNPKNQGLED